MGEYFEGWYFKHQKNHATLAVIPGRSDREAFIQVITDEQTHYIAYPLSSYSLGGKVSIGENIFSKQGIRMNIDTSQLVLKGTLRYTGLTPITGDIMGPFRFLPMECIHSVVSMSHQIIGTLQMDGRIMDFSGGKGYIEGDRGRSFPESYSWVQSNDFEEDCSIMASVAKIPMLGFWFWGCICVVWYQGQEYRLASYRGAKVVRRYRNGLEIRQNKYRLMVDVPCCQGYVLAAPDNGVMCRTIHESPACSARFRFFIDNRPVIDKWSSSTSYEFVE